MPPRGDPATWLVAGAAMAGVVAAAILRPMRHRRWWQGLRIHRQRATDSLSKTVYVSEQVCIR